jgi:hypothetical protein
MLVISTYEHLSPFGAPSLSPHDQPPRMADFRGFMPISSLARRIVAQENPSAAARDLILGCGNGPLASKSCSHVLHHSEFGRAFCADYYRELHRD